MMVPVTWINHGTLWHTLMETSAAMSLPRANLNSQSRGDQHEIFSAVTAAQLEQPGICHEGPTTRSSTVKPSRRSIDREGTR